MPEQSNVSSDLELFTRELTWNTRPVISQFWSPAACSFLGFSFVAISNYLQRRPILSGIQRHIIAGGLGIPFGLYLQKKLDERHALRDAKLVYYMKLHPEEFPVTERKKFKDVLLPWVPMR